MEADLRLQPTLSCMSNRQYQRQPATGAHRPWTTCRGPSAGRTGGQLTVGGSPGGEEEEEGEEEPAAAQMRRWEGPTDQNEEGSVIRNSTSNNASAAAAMALGHGV